ncbi:MAG: hypothetical protein ACJAQT_001657 [Akkermansiaceae bacterium]|jgi:hypothetical protein
MSKKGQRKSYQLDEGTVIEREFYGKTYRLLVVKNHHGLQFKVEDRVFSSLTAAARHVVGDPDRQISGPRFWGLTK